uniref:PX domain-containing protein n=1 Tax=Phytophthora ramorum TaxID=164328 RepID=H3GCQ9_PHYRM
MRPLHWLLTLAALLLGARYSWAVLLLLRATWWMVTRLLQVVVLLAGSSSFWWLLRSYQLQKEQELLDHALLKFKFYSRYRSRVGSGHYSGGARSSGSVGGDYSLSAAAFGGSMTDAGFQLRVLKRLPIVAHLRTSWSLPPEICEEIGALVQQIVKDYVNFWFQAISPNEDFPNDVKFLLADLLGAMASRVLEIDPSQALTMVAKSLELLRLHLGWFREAYAQLADEYPSVFEGDENDSNLLKRQEYVTAFVQRSPFVHPGCVGTGAPSSPQATVTPLAPGGGNVSKKNASENAEAAYLRHVATQLLNQLKPQLGQQQDANVFVSIAMNLLREVTAFKILKPLSEYSQPRYANEIVLSCLQVFVDEKDVVGPMSPTMSSGSNGVGMVPTLTLNKLRTTSSFLYKASRRSGEQAEAAFQAVVEAVASAASSAAAGAAEMVFEGDDWADSTNPFAFGSAVFAGSTGDKKAMPSIFAMDDRLNVAKAAKMMNPRGFIPGGLLSHKMTGENSRIGAHMDDLKNAKANIGSSLNSSIGKVKKRFRTLGSHQMDPMSTPPLSAGAGAAARMIRKPGQLLQKAWKRGESGASSPTSSFDDGAVTPTGSSRGRSYPHTMGSLNPLLSPMGDDEGETTPRTASGDMKMAMVRDRAVVHLEKAVMNYTKMHDECPEMRNSARSRELYDLLSAMEDALMLGFRDHDSKTPSSEDDNEKGSVGTFWTELYAHSDITETFYENYALLLDATLMESALGALSQLDKLKRWQDLPSSEWIWEDEWALENAGNDAEESSDSESPSSAWEYAKTFEDNFHEKEKKFDSVRRRRARKLKQRFNALTRDKKKEKGAASKKSLLRRRSKSFDKEMPDSPIRDSMLEMMESDGSQHTSTKTSAFMKARASIPSLRRGISNKSTKSTTTDAQALSSKASIDDDPAALYDNDEDDDENLCFRCLKALPASKSGAGSCQSCHQRVCTSCLDFFAFLVYPPPLEASKKSRVCGNCYDRLVNKYKLRIDAHVGKYLIKERERELPDLFSSSTSNNTSAGSSANGSPHQALSPSSNGSASGSFGDLSASGQPLSPLSPTISRAGSSKFEITVKVKDDSAYAWSVIKTFHDFEVLEKQLAEKLKKQEKKCGVGCQACHLRGVDYMEIASIKPSLKTVTAATLTYEKRLYVLEQFVQQLLTCDTLCQSSVVQKFLLLANAYGTSPAAGNPSLSGWEVENLAFPSASTSTGGTPGGGSGAGGGGAGGVLVENGKWKKGRWIAPDANSKETKMRVLQKIEVSLFAVLGEVFEFDGIGMVRRQIFSMTRSFIKAFLGASHFRMLERQFLSFTDPKKLSGWIGDLRLYIFPDSSDANAAPPPAPDMQVLRKDCLEAILASFPSKALSLFGDTACENAALKLHEFLQHEVFVKNLLFSITDELLLHLFPDSTTFKGKKAPGGAPPPASPSAIAVATTIAKEAAWSRRR